MQLCQEGKKSKRFSPGSDFTEQIFTRELSRVDSAGVLRQSVCIVNIYYGSSLFNISSTFIQSAPFKVF